MVEQIRGALAASRTQADDVLARAVEDARQLELSAEAGVRRRAEDRLAEIEYLRVSIDHHSQEIEAAYVRLVETLAATSMRLVEIARDADFSPPPWPGGLDRIVELKLSETREVTLRLGGERDHDGR